MKGVLKVGVCAACAAVTLGVTAARADDGPWEVRLRADYLDPANHSDAYGPLGIPRDAIHVNDKWLPDLDFEYFFTPHWSSELVLTYPQSQQVTVEHSALGGPTVIGTFKHLPPTLTAKYNFLPENAFQPYVGAGVNLTIISDTHLDVPTVGRLDLDHTSVGPAAQAGFDYRIADHWYFNADVKWIMIRSDVKFEGTKISEARLDPLLFGIGFGYRFGGSKAAAQPVAATAPPPPPVAPPPAPAAAPPPAAPVPPPVKVTQETVLKGVNFETASAKLRPESTAVLDELAGTIEHCQCTSVQIRGYTDSVGKPDYNKKLSDRRALAVKNYLVQKGIPAGALSTEGFGEENPLASNATPEGRAANRRVTVQFVTRTDR